MWASELEIPVDAAPRCEAPPPPGSGPPPLRATQRRQHSRADQVRVHPNSSLLAREPLCIASLSRLSLLETGLLQDRVQGTRRNIKTWLSRHGHPTWLATVLELPVTTPRSNEDPPILLKKADQFAHFHASSSFPGAGAHVTAMTITRPSGRVKGRQEPDRSRPLILQPAPPPAPPSRPLVAHIPVGDHLGIESRAHGCPRRSRCSSRPRGHAYAHAPEGSYPGIPRAGSSRSGIACVRPFAPNPGDDSGDGPRGRVTGRSWDRYPDDWCSRRNGEDDESGPEVHELAPSAGHESVLPWNNRYSRPSACEPVAASWLLIGAALDDRVHQYRHADRQSDVSPIDDT